MSEKMIKKLVSTCNQNKKCKRIEVELSGVQEKVVYVRSNDNRVDSISGSD